MNNMRSGEVGGLLKKCTKANKRLGDEESSEPI